MVFTTTNESANCMLTSITEKQEASQCGAGVYRSLTLAHAWEILSYSCSKFFVAVRRVACHEHGGENRSCDGIAISLG